MEILEYKIESAIPGIMTVLKTLETMTIVDLESIKPPPMKTLREFAEEARRRELSKD